MSVTSSLRLKRNNKRWSLFVIPVLVSFFSLTIAWKILAIFSFIEIKPDSREIDDLSTPAVIQGVFEVHCDAASTELEATEMDAITEAGALNDVESEQLFPSSLNMTSTKEAAMEKVNAMRLLITYSALLLISTLSFCYYAQFSILG